MGTIASQITSLTIVYSTVYSEIDQRKHQSSASLAFVRGIHRGPVNSPHKWPVTRKMFPFDDVIMKPVDMVSCILINSGSGKDLSPVRRQVITSSNVGLLTKEWKPSVKFWMDFVWIQPPQKTPSKWWRPFWSSLIAMMTSSNGNIFRVTGPLCGEFPGLRWIPRTKASDTELWCFLWSVSK